MFKGQALMFMDVTHTMAPQALTKSHDQAELAGPQFMAGFQGQIKGHRRNAGEKEWEEKKGAGRVA